MSDEEKVSRCKGCNVPVQWAEYEKPPHKRAPLVLAANYENTVPNIVIMLGEGSNYTYRIVEPGTDGAQYVNHFSNCAKKSDFKRKKATT